MTTSWPKPFLVQARNGLHVRVEPRRAAPSLALLPRGSQVRALRPPADGWIAIEFQRDTAYVSFRYLLPAERRAAPALAPFLFGAWPTTEYRITQPFAARPHYYARYHLPGHEGVDIAAPLDTPIFAVATGKVLYVGDRRRDGRPSPYGWHLEIDHGFGAHGHPGYRTLYAHLAPVLPVGKAQVVRAGQIIGYSGNSGQSTGAHLHLSLYAPNGLPGWPPHLADPTPLLQPLFDRYRRQQEEAKKHAQIH